MKIDATIKLKAYNIIADNIELGVEAGLNRYDDSVETPLSEAQHWALKHHLHHEIMLTLAEVIDFEDQ